MEENEIILRGETRYGSPASIKFRPKSIRWNSAGTEGEGVLEVTAVVADFSGTVTWYCYVSLVLAFFEKLDKLAFGEEGNIILYDLDSNDQITVNSVGRRGHVAIACRLCSEPIIPDWDDVARGHTESFARLECSFSTDHSWLMSLGSEAYRVMQSTKGLRSD